MCHLRDLSRPSGTLPGGEGLVVEISLIDDEGRWWQPVPPLRGGCPKGGRGPFGATRDYPGLVFILYTDEHHERQGEKAGCDVHCDIG
jgi:hypothetical protein